MKTAGNVLSLAGEEYRSAWPVRQYQRWLDESHTPILLYNETNSADELRKRLVLLEVNYLDKVSMANRVSMNDNPVRVGSG